MLDATEGEGLVLFRVRDHGRGIPADKLESIFERFEQVDSSDARQKGGTGLGLAISRSIIERHGGRIWAESELGVGTTVQFTLPSVDAGRPTAPAEPAFPTVAPLREVEAQILLVEDDEDLAGVIMALLADQGLEVVHATTAADAVARGRQLRVEAVILDLQLPDVTAPGSCRAAPRGRPCGRAAAGLQRGRRRDPAPSRPVAGPHRLPDEGPGGPRGAARPAGGPSSTHHRKTRGIARCDDPTTSPRPTPAGPDISVRTGTGSGRTLLSAFDSALLAAGVANFNLIALSSVIPPRQQGPHRRHRPARWPRRPALLRALRGVRRPPGRVRLGRAGLGLRREHRRLLRRAQGRQRGVPARADRAESGGHDRQPGRGYGPVHMATASAHCVDRPVCALTIAAYEVVPWSPDA